MAVDWISSFNLESWSQLSSKKCGIYSVRAGLKSESCSVLLRVAPGFSSSQGPWAGQWTGHGLGFTCRCNRMKDIWWLWSAAAGPKLWQAFLQTKVYLMILRIHPGVDRQKYSRNLSHVSYSSNSVNRLWILDTNSPIWLCSSVKCLMPLSPGPCSSGTRMQFLGVDCTCSVCISITVLLHCCCLCSLTSGRKGFRQFASLRAL